VGILEMGRRWLISVSGLRAMGGPVGGVHGPRRPVLTRAVLGFSYRTTNLILKSTRIFL
jgi:hypothetical protein